MQLSNNIVFITGGSSGIGLALARAFLRKIYIVLYSII